MATDTQQRLRPPTAGAATPAQRPCPTDLVGAFLDVNDASVQLSTHFSDWLTVNTSSILEEGGAGPPADALPALLARLGSLAFCAEFAAAYAVEPHWADCSVPVAQPDLLVRVFTVRGCDTIASEDKVVVGWDLADFTLGAADSVSAQGQSLVVVETPIAFPDWDADVDVLAPLRVESVPSLEAFLSDALAQLMSVKVAGKVVPSADPLHVQFEGRIRDLLAARPNAESIEGVIGEFVSTQQFRSSPVSASYSARRSGARTAGERGWRWWATFSRPSSPAPPSATPLRCGSPTGCSPGSRSRPRPPPARRWRTT